MNAKERKTRRAEISAEVEARMKALAVLIYSADREGVYADSPLPDSERRVLQVGLTFGPEFPALPLPGAE